MTDSQILGWAVPPSSKSGKAHLFGVIIPSSKLFTLCGHRPASIQFLTEFTSSQLQKSTCSRCLNALSELASEGEGGCADFLDACTAFDPVLDAGRVGGLETRAGHSNAPHYSHDGSF